MKINKILLGVICGFLFVIAASCFYYFVLFLPDFKRQEFELMESKQEKEIELLEDKQRQAEEELRLKEEEENRLQQEKQQKQINLDNCLYEVQFAHDDEVNFIVNEMACDKKIEGSIDQYACVDVLSQFVDEKEAELSLEKDRCYDRYN